MATMLSSRKWRSKGCVGLSRASSILWRLPDVQALNTWSMGTAGAVLYKSVFPSMVQVAVEEQGTQVPLELLLGLVSALLACATQTTATDRQGPRSTSNLQGGE